LYGRIPDQVDLLLRNRQIDLCLKHKAFDNLKETQQFVDIKLSRDFILLNRAGTVLFERTRMMMPIIRVEYQNRELKIRMLKQGQWFENLENLLNMIMSVYDELSASNEPMNFD